MERFFILQYNILWKKIKNLSDFKNIKIIPEKKLKIFRFWFDYFRFCFKDNFSSKNPRGRA